MPLAKVDAKLLNIDRVVQFGKKDTLELVDRTTKESLATVKKWDFTQLNPLDQNAPSFKFIIAETTDTEEYLPNCLIAFNNKIHDVVVRNKPTSRGSTLWEFRTRPTNTVLG
jgi:hypothetical protein